MSDKPFDNHHVSHATLWGDYVAVMFAESQGEADRCRQLLEMHGIPARLEADAHVTGRRAEISVLVPGSRLEEASDLVSTGHWSGTLGDRHRFELKAGPADDDDETDDFDDEDDEFDDEDEDEDLDEDTDDDMFDEDDEDDFDDDGEDE